MQPTGEQIEELEKALLSAFNLDELRRMLHFRLNLILDQVVPVPNQTLTDIAYNTTRWAAAQEGGFLGLAENALAERPDNPELREFVTRYAGCTFDRLPEATARYGKGLDIPDPVPPMHPPRSQTFVGRHDELSELTRALKKEAFVALVGAPGMGKSELATRLAAQKAPGFERVFWYEFTSPADADDLVYQLANFLAWYGRDDLWRRRHTSGNAAGKQVKQQFQLALSLLKQGSFLLYLEDLHNAQDDALIQDFLGQLVARRAAAPCIYGG
ncbi:MAG: effector-associated domain EAD1-containing protein [Caldilineaceae bacterium]